MGGQETDGKADNSQGECSLTAFKHRENSPLQPGGKCIKNI